MYNIEKVRQCIKGLVGWKPSQDPCAPTLSTQIKASETGLFFNTSHPLLTIENLKMAAPEFHLFNWNSWDIAKAYIIGDVVDEGGVQYIALADNTGLTPSANPAEWEAYDAFSTWLESNTDSFADEFVRALFTEKKLTGITKSIFEDKPLFLGLGRMDDLVVKSGRFVGWKFHILPHENLRLAISKLGFQFSETQTDLPIYLYHSSQVDALAKVLISTDKAFSFRWSDQFTADLFYNSADHAPEGEYYLGYYEDDLAGQAINRGIRLDARCTACADRSSISYHRRTLSKYFQAIPFSVRNDALNGEQLFDVDYVSETWSNNYGLNAQLGLYCDLSDFLCRNKDLMAAALHKYVGLQFLKIIANSTNLSRINSATQQLAQMELDDRQGAYTMKQEVANLMKEVNFDFSNLGTVCLPCEGGGITVSNI